MSAKAPATLVPPGLPQVNLLPPEVRAARGLKVVKRWLAVSLGLVLVLVGAAYAFAVIVRGQSADELVKANEETVTLKAEEARYAEVPAVLSALASVKQARELGMSTEVTWKPYVDAITAVLPEGVSFESLTMTGATPMAAPPATPNPLQAPYVNTLTFTGRSLTVPDAANWIDSLNGIPGFSDAWVSTATVAGEEGQSYYVLTATVQVTEQAYAHRFPITEQES